MYRISTTKKCPIQGTIKFKKQPWALGYKEDVDGNLWDIQGYYGLADGKAYVQACLVKCLHPGLTDTSGFRMGYSQEWKPYMVEIVPSSEDSCQKK